ncbi:MAG: ATP-binding protein [Bacteroidota bacterium]
MKIVFRFALILCLIYPALLYGQQTVPTFLQIGEEEGLVSTDILRFHHDSRGFIWFGTPKGISCYDGTRIRNYTEQEGLCYNYILQVTEDQKGNIWIYGGDFSRRERYLCVLDPIEEIFYDMETYLGGPVPFDIDQTDIYSSHQGVILMREERETLFQFYEWNGYRLKKGFIFPKSSQYNLFRPQDQVYKQDADTYVTELVVRQGGAPPDPPLRSIVHFDSTGKIQKTVDTQGRPGYLATDGSDLHYKLGEDVSPFLWSYYVDERLAFEEVIPSQNDDFMYWGKGMSFLLLDEELRIQYKQGDSLKFDTLDVPREFQPNGSDIFLDHTPALWYEANNHFVRLGVHKKWFRTWFQYEEFNGWAAPIRGITPDKEGNLWVGSQHLLYRLDRMQNQGYRQKTLDGDLLEGILGIFYADPYLWMATERSGLVRFHIQDQTSKSFPLFGMNRPTLLWQPYQSTKGDIWVGAGEGLYQLDESQGHLRKLQPAPEFEALNTSSIFHFYESEEGVWLSTSSGLYLADLAQEKILARYHQDQPEPYFLPIDQVAHIHVDSLGIMWLATKGQGLIKWNPRTQEHQIYNQKSSGLSNDVLYAVYEDAWGYLWLPSNHGLNRLHKASGRMHLYFEEDGLPHNEFNTTSHYQAPDGSLFLGTLNGMTQFHPRDFDRNPKEVPLLISRATRIDRSTDSVTIETHAVLNQRRLHLYPSDRTAFLHLTLLDHTKESGKQYAYKIEGIHEDWIQNSGPDIEFSGLPFGTYDVALRAKSTSTNIWTVYPAPIQLIVVSPFYLKTWFVLLVICLGAAGLYLLYRYNTRRLRRRQAQLKQIVEERTEEIRKQAEELKALDNAKSRFFANISHELRTPLTLMLGPLSYLQSNPDKWPSMDLSSQFQVMERNGRSLLGMIDEILDLTKLQDRKLKLEQQATDLQVFVQRVAEPFAVYFSQKGVQFNVQLKISKALHVCLDQRKIEKMLNNYLVNALKYTPPGGWVTLTVKEKAEVISFMVSDTGVGIEEEELKHIFERFYQGNQALSGGTGIGLELVKEYASLMGGAAFAESKIGQGSDFFFILPKQKMQISASSSQKSPRKENVGMSTSPNLSREHTLIVVENHPDMRDFIYQILQDQYKEIILVPHGKACLEVLNERASDISLIISDMMMPEMDGMSLLKAVRNQPAWAHISVMMLTAMGSEPAKIEALTSGADDYVTKPFTLQELQMRVQKVLSKTRRV